MAEPVRPALECIDGGACLARFRGGHALDLHRPGLHPPRSATDTVRLTMGGHAESRTYQTSAQSQPRVHVEVDQAQPTFGALRRAVEPDVRGHSRSAYSACSSAGSRRSSPARKLIDRSNEPTRTNQPRIARVLHNRHADNS